MENNTSLSNSSASVRSFDSSWRSSIVAEWRVRRSTEDTSQSVLFPLAMNPFGEEEVLAMIEVLLSGRLTLGAEVERAEETFAQIVGVPYAVMVNSGSSANLIAVSAVANKLRSIHCNPDDHVLVPAVCWSTSVFPLLQNGLRPVFVDVNPRTFNVTLDELERKFTPQVKAVMAVHVLGNSIDMRQMIDFVKRHNLILIEDTCESLGSFCDGNAAGDRQMLGTFGDFGTFSFYFSHHITSGEGGMITCKTEEDYNLVRCLRAHGWTRHLTNRRMVEDMYPDFDNRFLFVNMGYNCRPLEVQGAMLNVQLQKLPQFNAYRRSNLRLIRQALEADERFSRLMSLMEASSGVDPAWFGLGVLLHRSYAYQRLDFLKYLEANGIENRPIISGNFIRQPCITAFCDQEQPENYPGAEAVHMRGFFIGVHQIPLDQGVIEKLVTTMLGFPFHPQHVVLVTRSDNMLGQYIRDALIEEIASQDSELKQCASLPLEIKTLNSHWVFLTHNDGDLRDIDDVQSIFKRFQPTRVLHCAEYLGSVDEMVTKPVNIWLDHVTMNNNILKTAFEFQSWSGPIKVVSILSPSILAHKKSFFTDCTSTCNQTSSLEIESYSHATLALAQLIRWFRQQHGCEFVSIVSDKIYGAYGNFAYHMDQFLHSLMATVLNRKENDSLTTVVLKGESSTKHRVLFAQDLAKIMLWSLEHYNKDEPLLVTGEEVFTSDITQIICELANFTGHVVFDHHPEYVGLQRVTHGMIDFRTLDLPFKMTSLSTAIKHTMEWYRNKTS